MIMRWFLSLSLLLALNVTPLLSADSPVQPNIIVVMPDDMGYGDLGATGNTVVRTPNLDRLASESAQMSEFYVSPVCSPTRACLMTGRYNYRTRVIDTFKGRSMMEPEEVTVAEALHEAGYATGIFGKWHLGDNYPLRPQDQGFDEVLIHRGGGLAQPSEPIENAGRYTDPILFHNGKQVQSKGYCTDVYFDAAIDFMKQSQKAKKPFFVYLPPNAPHGPYHDVPEDLLAYYQSDAVSLDPMLNGNLSDKHRDTVARVFAMVENIDQNMGKLDRYLADSGQLENTMVIFLTDNGPNSPRYVGPFRGMKSDVHEGGIRTVFYARWPKVLKPGTKSEMIAAHIDLMPTLLEVAGAKQPDGVKFDGRSLLPLLKGEAIKWPGRFLVLQSHRGDVPAEEHHFALRTQRWKLLRPSGFGNEQQDPSKPTPLELYAIGKDVGESDNLAEKRPKIVEALLEKYHQWFSDVGSTRGDNYAPPRIILGSDEETLSDLSIQDWRVGAADGWGKSGKWMVDIVDTGPYAVEVKWEDSIGAREVILNVGVKQFSAQLADGASVANFGEIELPKGEVAISVDVSGEIGRGDVLRFVTLQRVPN